MGINDKIRYMVTLPDGGIATRDSQKRYTHVVAVAMDRTCWDILGCFSSRELAERRKATHDRLWPDAPCEVLPVVPTVPLTDRQRAFLIEIGDRTIEIMGTTHLFSLVQRGLLERQLIGMRWWRVRRTSAGRTAITAVAATAAETSSDRPEPRT